MEPTILNGTSTTFTVVLTAVPAKLATAQPEMSGNHKQINKILITSDFASFNSSNYDTFFRENIKIIYENHIITSDKIDFNFVRNTILIYENVLYTGFKEEIITDNIKINLITKVICQINIMLQEELNLEIQKKCSELISIHIFLQWFYQ